MTPLVIVAGLLIAAGLLAGLGRRRREVRETTRRQLRALDTLGQISAAHRAADSPGGAPEFAATPHVRVVAADAEPPRPAPRPIAGGWKPARATGAAPFRSPAPRGPHPPITSVRSDVGAVPTSVLEFAVDPEPAPSVRIVPADRAAGLQDPVPDHRPVTDHRPVARRREPPEPVDDVLLPTLEQLLWAEDQAAAQGDDAGLDDLPHVDDGAGAPPVTPETATGGTGARGGTSTGDGTAAAPGASRAADLLHFDDLESAPTRTVPEPVTRAPIADPAARAAWAAQLATARDAAGPLRRHRRPGRRSALAAGALGASAALVVAAVLVTAGRPAGSHPAPTAARAAHPAAARHPRRSAPASGVAPGSGAGAGSVQLVAHTVGISVYRLTGPERITLAASGPCWVEVRSTNDEGPTIYSQTMQAGQTESVLGPTWIRLGNPPAVDVAVDGTQVSPPVSAGLPYNLEFR